MSAARTAVLIIFRFIKHLPFFFWIIYILTYADKKSKLYFQKVAMSILEIIFTFRFIFFKGCGIILTDIINKGMSVKCFVISNEYMEKFECSGKGFQSAREFPRRQ